MTLVGNSSTSRRLTGVMDWLWLGAAMIFLDAVITSWLGGQKLDVTSALLTRPLIASWFAAALVAWIAWGTRRQLADVVADVSVWWLFLAAAWIVNGIWNALGGSPRSVSIGLLFALLVYVFYSGKKVWLETSERGRALGAALGLSLTFICLLLVPSLVGWLGLRSGETGWRASSVALARGLVMQVPDSYAWLNLHERFSVALGLEMETGARLLLASLAYLAWLVVLGWMAWRAVRRDEGLVRKIFSYDLGLAGLFLILGLSVGRVTGGLFVRGIWGSAAELILASVFVLVWTRSFFRSNVLFALAGAALLGWPILAATSVSLIADEVAGLPRIAERKWWPPLFLTLRLLAWFAVGWWFTSLQVKALFPGGWLLGLGLWTFTLLILRASSPLHEWFEQQTWSRWKTLVSAGLLGLTYFIFPLLVGWSDGYVLAALFGCASAYLYWLGRARERWSMRLALTFIFLVIVSTWMMSSP